MALLLARSRSLTLVSRSRFQFHTGRGGFNTNKIFKEEREFSDGSVGMISRSLIRLRDMLDRRLEQRCTIRYDIPSAGGNLRFEFPPSVRKEEVKLTLKGATIVLQAGNDLNRIIKLSDNVNFTADEIKTKFKDGILTIYFPKEKEKEKGEQELKICFPDPELPKISK